MAVMGTRGAPPWTTLKPLGPAMKQTARAAVATRPLKVIKKGTAKYPWRVPLTLLRPLHPKSLRQVGGLTTLLVLTTATTTLFPPAVTLDDAQYPAFRQRPALPGQFFVSMTAMLVPRPTGIPRTWHALPVFVVYVLQGLLLITFDILLLVPTRERMRK